VLTVLSLAAVVYVVTRIVPETAPSNNSVERDVSRVLNDSIFCSPNTTEVQTLMSKTLSYLKQPLPRLSYYPSADVAEEEYLKVIASAHAAGSRIIGIDFVKTNHYSLRFRVSDVANTENLFSHARKQLLSFILFSSYECLCLMETLVIT